MLFPFFGFVPCGRNGWQSWSGHGRTIASPRMVQRVSVWECVFPKYQMPHWIFGRNMRRRSMMRCLLFHRIIIYVFAVYHVVVEDRMRLKCLINICSARTLKLRLGMHRVEQCKMHCETYCIDRRISGSTYNAPATLSARMEIECGRHRRCSDNCFDFRCRGEPYKMTKEKFSSISCTFRWKPNMMAFEVGASPSALDAVSKLIGITSKPTMRM